MKENKPDILLCNDDGIYAPGIRALWECLKDVANITIVAPSDNQSCKGAGISAPSTRVIEAEKVDWEDTTEAWKVHGTPADAIKFALDFLLDHKPDLLCSGINHGSNAGRNVLYSGTVGAAVQATFSGVQGIALSCMWDEGPEKYKKVQPYIPEIVQHVLRNKLPEDTLLNINFPHHPADGLKGFKMAKQGLGYWDLRIGKDPALRGTNNYPMYEENEIHEEPDDTDIYLLREGHITIVPIQVKDLTNHQLHREQKPHFENLNKKFNFPLTEGA